MNIFTNLLLAIVILVQINLFKRIFRVVYFTEQYVLRFSLNTNIIFQSCQTMLLLTTSEISFFTNSICVFAILTIIVLNCPKP